MGEKKKEEDRYFYSWSWAWAWATIGTWEERSHPTPHLPTMTKLHQHQAAMTHGGCSPYFGWILDGQQVTEAEYWAARDRADRDDERAGRLWN